MKAKTLWEQLRREDCPKEKMETLLNDLFKCSKPYLETVSFFLANYECTYCCVLLNLIIYFNF